MPHSPSLLGRVDRTGLPLLAARLAIGVAFILMGFAKIVEPADFLKLMRQYRALPESPAYVMNSVAVVLPWFEVTCGAALLLGVGVRGAGLISAVMLFVFTPMVLMRGLELYREGVANAFCAVKFDCGCGAGIVHLCNKLAENIALFLLALVAVTSRSRRFCLVALLKRDTK